MTTSDTWTEDDEWAHVDEKVFGRWIDLVTVGINDMTATVEAMEYSTEPGGPITHIAEHGITVKATGFEYDVVNGFLSELNDGIQIPERARILAARARALAELLPIAADALERIANTEGTPA